MKRFVCMLGVMLVLLGVRAGNNGLCGLRLSGDAVFSVYRKGGAAETYKYRNVSMLDGYGEYLAQRLDFDGGMSGAEALIKQLNGKEVSREVLEDAGGMTIIYALAPRLRMRTKERGREFNIMVAVRGDRVAAGYPILMGSY